MDNTMDKDKLPQQNELLELRQLVENKRAFLSSIMWVHNGSHISSLLSMMIWYNVSWFNLSSRKRKVAGTIAQSNLRVKSPLQAKCLASVIEQKLFRSAPSLQAYLNLSTLEMRVRIACLLLARRIEIRKKLLGINSKTTVWFDKLIFF